MANLTGFNAAEVEPNKGFDPIPAGYYPGAMVASEMKTTQAGTGQYLKCEFQILDGEFKGRKLWVNLNLDNPNAEAVRIARGELSAICRACGVLVPKDSAELHNVPISLKVGLRKNSQTQELENVIKGYEAKGAPVAAAPVAAGSTPPWQRKAN